MNTRVASLILTSWRSLARSVVLGLLPLVGWPLAWAQTDAAQQGPNAKRQELRNMVRQPHPTPASASGKVVEQRHLSAEERSQLRRQLTRELRAQNAALADASRP
jgi:hypothetical protein